MTRSRAAVRRLGSVRVGSGGVGGMTRHEIGQSHSKLLSRDFMRRKCFQFCVFVQLCLFVRKCMPVCIHSLCYNACTKSLLSAPFNLIEMGIISICYDFISSCLLLMS